MNRRDVLKVASLMALRPVSAWAQTTRIEPILPPDASQAAILPPDDGLDNDVPKKTWGVELANINGWLANIYPSWRYVREYATVHPLPELWQEGEYQSSPQVTEQTQILVHYGSGADVVEYNPNPNAPDYNRLLGSYFKNESLAHRPFFISWGMMFGSSYEPADGAKDMSLPSNRQKFEEELDFMFENIIWPNYNRYVTRNGKALVYLWSVVSLHGDLASLLDEMRVKYPVAFVGSVNMLYLPTDEENKRNFKALDIIMEYALYPSATEEEKAAGKISYSRMIGLYKAGLDSLIKMIGEFREEGSKLEHLVVPTVQFAFDDTNYPGRDNLPMYPENEDEVDGFFGWIAEEIEKGVKGKFGPIKLKPFVKISEHYEGDAAEPSQCLLATEDRPGRFVGCGLVRLEMLKKHFATKK